MGYKTIYIEFDIKNEMYERYEKIIDSFVEELYNSDCLSDINDDISVQEIDQSEMGIPF